MKIYGEKINIRKTGRQALLLRQLQTNFGDSKKTKNENVMQVNQ